MTSKEDAEIKVVAEGDGYTIYDVQTYDSSPASSSGNQFVKQEYAENNDVGYNELSSTKLGLWSGPEVRRSRPRKIMETSAVILVYEKNGLVEDREFVR